MSARSWTRLWTYLQPYRARFAAGLALTLLSTLAAAIAPRLIGHAVDLLQEAEAGRVTEAAIFWAAGAVVLFACLRSVFSALGRYLVVALSRDFEFDMRRDLYRHLLSLAPAWFDRHPTGDLTSRFVNDLDGVRMMVGFSLLQITGTGLLLFMGITGLLLLDVKLTLICLIPMVAISALTFLLSSRLHDYSRRVQDQLGDLSNRAQESFSGIRVVKAFALEEADAQRFAAECRTYLGLNMRLTWLRSGFHAALGLLMELSIAAILYFGSRRIISGDFSQGDFAAFIAYQFMLVWPMMSIGLVVSLVQRGRACLERLIAIWDEPPAPTGTEPVELLGGIDVRHLTFQFTPDRPPALVDVSFSLAPGESLGVVGTTGSGKSALASVLLKIFPAPPGSCYIDGRDLNEVATESLRRQVGAVTADAHIFSDTLQANIEFGADQAPDAAAVAEAVRMARLTDEIARFPDGLETLVGERGVTLSGGQRQRTALARALLRRPRLLVLDDALSSVDARTEQEILSELRTFMQGRSSIIVSHRMTAVRTCDRILVLEGGRLVEQGTHATLLAQDGRYARMCEQQQLLEALTAADRRVSPAPGSEIDSSAPRRITRGETP